MGEFNIPANKFAGLFRQFTGKSFSEYINDLRIEYVAELLLSGKYASVEELLKECTFISSTSLYRLFTKKYGMTPQSSCGMHGYVKQKKKVSKTTGCCFLLKN